MAVGGNWGGKKGVDKDAFRGEGQKMEIDWVKVYQRQSNSGGDPSPGPSPSAGSDALEDKGKDPSETLQKCQGDCDSDNNCAQGLRCHQRDGLESVPGCSGTGTWDFDYCVPSSTSGGDPSPGPSPNPSPGPSSTTCDASKVTRRRREADMCSCRRRNGPDNGWTCGADDSVVVDNNYVPPLPPASSSDRSIKIMNYNVMGWSACGRRRRRNLPPRGVVITRKINDYDPVVLAAQEVETGGGQGFENCEAALVANTKLDSGLYKKSVLERRSTSWTKLKGGYWMAGSRYRHKISGKEFLLFNSHWKHGYGDEQVRTAAQAIDAERKKYGSPPTLLMGDTNQFCKGYEKSAYKYLTGQISGSPVKFVDVHKGDFGRSFGDGGDCRVDFIFASVGQWSLVQAAIDRDGMGQNGEASDHAALKAELLPN